MCENKECNEKNKKLLTQEENFCTALKHISQIGTIIEFQNTHLLH